MSAQNPTNADIMRELRRQHHEQEHERQRLRRQLNAALGIIERRLDSIERRLEALFVIFPLFSYLQDVATNSHLARTGSGVL